MPLEQLPALLLAILAVGYTPGPANIYAMSCSLRHGWRRSMRMWLGLLCGFLTAALIAATAAHFMGIAFVYEQSYNKRKQITPLFTCWVLVSFEVPMVCDFSLSVQEIPRAITDAWTFQ